jgi:hypothetical protein
LGVDHYYCKKENTLFIRYTYRCPAELDAESTEYWVKALFKKHIINEIKRHYKSEGFKKPRVKCSKFDYTAEKKREAIQNDSSADVINFKQDFAMEADEYCSINTCIVYRAFPNNVFVEEEIRYYALLMPNYETIYIGVKSFYNEESEIISVEYSFDRYSANIDKELLEFLIEDFQKYYKKKGNRVNQVVKRFRKPLSFDPDEQAI